MLSYPEIGQTVRIAYRVGSRLNQPGQPPVWPLDCRTGIVRIRSKGKGPRNHGVEILGRLYVVPAGHLMPVKAAPPAAPTPATPPPPRA